MASRRRRADLARAEAAVRELLAALGIDPTDPAFAIAPATASRAYAERLLDGYASTADDALGRGYPVERSDAVIATRIPLLFVCPHHLMPAQGEAHVAFIPRGRVPGFGRIARLCDVLGHRLVLQEDLTHAIVRALRDHLDVEAALAIVEARHLCVALEDFARRNTTFRTRAALGSREAIASLAHEIDASLGTSWPTSSSKPHSSRRSSKSPSRPAPASAATPKKRTTSRPRRRSRSGGS
jgi:GTP cyclohydrolase I